MKTAKTGFHQKPFSTFGAETCGQTDVHDLTISVL